MSAPIRPTVSPEPAVEPAHPLGVAGGQVVVDGHHVHAALVQCVEIHGQGGDQGLPLTGLHFGDPAEVQRHAAHELHVEVALPEHPPGRFAHDCVGLDQEVIERLALVQALPELHRLVRQFGVAEGLHLRLQLRDGGDELGQASDLLALACLENLGEYTHEITILPVPGRSPAWRSCHRPGSDIAGCVRLTWSLTPHSPAARLTCRCRRPVDVTARDPTAPLWHASPRRRPPPGIGSSPGRAYL